MPSEMPQRISCGRVPVELADLVRADANSVALTDEHRVSPAVTPSTSGDVDANLVHAHDPDDRAAPPADRRDVRGSRAHAADPVRSRALRWRSGGRFGSPGAPVADALAGGRRCAPGRRGRRRSSPAGATPGPAPAGSRKRRCRRAPGRGAWPDARGSRHCPRCGATRRARPAEVPRRPRESGRAG